MHRKLPSDETSGGALAAGAIASGSPADASVYSPQPNGIGSLNRSENSLGNGTGDATLNEEVPLQPRDTTSIDQPDGPQVPPLTKPPWYKLSRYGLGVALIVLVAIIWVAASMWIQWIFGSLDFNKPFFMTYFNTAGFMMWNFGYCLPFTKWREIPWRTSLDEERLGGAGGASSGSGTAAGVALETGPGRKLDLMAAAETDSFGTPSKPRGNNSFNVDGSAIAAANEAAEGGVGRPKRRYSLYRIFYAALLFCPLWFLANVLFNFSLSRTSVASNTILSTTSSVWTLIISRLLLKEPINVVKLLAIGLSVSGTAMVALADDKHSSSGQDTISGDLLALISAFFYAAYTTVLRWCLPDDDCYSMGQAFGAVGIINTVLMWPGFILLNYTGVEVAEFPSLKILGPLFLNTLIGTNLSDVLWAKSVILTSPLIATLGLCLTTPFAMIADGIIKHKSFSALYLCGAIVVTLGFVIANVKISKR